MKIVLVAMNAQYIHTSLSARSLAAYLESKGIETTVLEFTINQDIIMIENEIIKQTPDIVGFSTYIWNQEMVAKVLPIVKDVLPETKIIIGGPEASYENDFYFDLGADFLIQGEGERALYELLSYLQRGIPSLEEIPRVRYEENNVIICNEKLDVLDMNDIVFPYKKEELQENKIYYYQSSRGCPYKCSYCLSSNDTYEGSGMRFRQVDKVFEEIELFLEARVKQVKFVDRTFNANKEHAHAIWRWLIENDNGYTNFHFELGADLLTTSCIEILSTARVGLFQFEVGIQTTNRDTLVAVGRYTKLDILFSRIKDILALKNIHVHVDLIAGLPKEGFESFRNSFNDVYALFAHMLQLGFLKLLYGTRLYNERENLKLSARPYPPYEVYQTDVLSYKEMSILKNVEHMVDMYYNSRQFQKTLSVLVPNFPSPFDFYHMLSAYFITLEEHTIKQKRIRRYEILYSFAKTYASDDIEKVKDAIVFDLMERENFYLPTWVERPLSDSENEEVLILLNDNVWIDTYAPKHINQTPAQRKRQLPVVKFHHRVLDTMERSEPMFVLFDYEERDVFSYSQGTDITKHMKACRKEG